MDSLHADPEELDHSPQPHGLTLTHFDYVRSPYSDNIAIEIVKSDAEGFDFVHAIYGRQRFLWKDVDEKVATQLKRTCGSFGDNNVDDYAKACVPLGIHHRRLKTDERERILFEAWRDSNKYSDILQGLLQQSCDKNDPEAAGSHWGTDYWYKRPIGRVTERDRIIAATVIQWLGSNIGMQIIDALYHKSEYFRRHRERSS
jgi:hypothetical protein